jgi:hypothetical protein
MRWLLAMRQNDGGWAIPARTLGLPLKAMLSSREALEPDRSCPSSHLVTGIVVRALAAHRRYRRSPDTRRAAELLKSRFFCRDAYPDRAAPSYWLVFSYPYWWTDLRLSDEARRPGCYVLICRTAEALDLLLAIGWRQRR